MGFLTRLRNRLFGPELQDEPASETTNPMPEAVADSEAAVEQTPREAVEQAGGSVERAALVPDSGQGDPPPASAGGSSPTVAMSDAQPGDEVDSAVAARQERAAGRILDDESLRGGLTDDEFQPLLDWALAAADRVAAATAGLSDDTADARLDERLGQIRGKVRLAVEAVAAHQKGAEQQRSSALSVLVQSVGAANPALNGLAGLIAGRAGLSGAELAAAIAKALDDGTETNS